MAREARIGREKTMFGAISSLMAGAIRTEPRDSSDVPPEEDCEADDRVVGVETAVSRVEEVTSIIEGARDIAHDVSESVERIVEEAEKQERAVTELADSVDELSIGENGPTGPNGEG